MLGKAIGRGDLVESPEMIAERLTKAVNTGFAGTVALASESVQNARKAKEAHDTANSLRKRLDALQEPFNGLSKAQMAEVVALASKLREENSKAKAQNKMISKRKGLSH